MPSPGIPIFLKLEAGKVCRGGMPFVPSTTVCPRATVVPQVTRPSLHAKTAQNVLV